MEQYEYLNKALNMTEKAMQRADDNQERAMDRASEPPKRVQCDHCNGYENDDIAVHVRLCESCQNKLERYGRLLMALRDIYFWTDDKQTRETVQAALDYCREKT